MKGIIRVPEDASFDALDDYMGQMSPTMMVPQSSALMPAPAPSSSGGFTSILSTFSQIAQAGAAAYGAYQSTKKPKASAPTMAPFTPMPSFAPASTGMDTTTMLMIGGGALLVIGLGVTMVMMKKS